MESESEQNSSSESYVPNTSDIDTEDDEVEQNETKKMPVAMFAKTRKTRRQEETVVVEGSDSSDDDIDSKTRDWVLDQDFAEYVELQQEEKRPKVKKIKGDNYKARVRKAVDCDICGKPQKNIWRHMNTQHQEGKVEKKSTPVVSKRGYKIKICPIVECMKICENLKEHLVRSHHIKKDSEEVKRLLAMAEPISEKVKTPIKKPKRRERKLWPPKVYIITISSYLS